MLQDVHPEDLTPEPTADSEPVPTTKPVPKPVKDPKPEPRIAKSDQLYEPALTSFQELSSQSLIL